MIKPLFCMKNRRQKKSRKDDHSPFGEPKPSWLLLFYIVFSTALAVLPPGPVGRSRLLGPFVYRSFRGWSFCGLARCFQVPGIKPVRPGGFFCLSSDRLFLLVGVPVWGEPVKEKTENKNFNLSFLSLLSMSTRALTTSDPLCCSGCLIPGCKGTSKK